MSTLVTGRPGAVEQRVYSFAQGVAADLRDQSLVKFAKKNGEPDILLVTGVPVFRAGTFRDSWGEQSTWSEEDLQMMVDNYTKLRDDFLFEDVPVRDGHPSFLMGLTPGAGEVVGHHNDLRMEKLESRDGNTYPYLVADFEISEPHAAGKIQRRTWRNRSSEIGAYRTNAEVEYAPVYMGVAYVDIPAVEGLNVNGHRKFSRESGNRFFTMAGRDFSVSDSDKNPPGTGTPPTQPSPTTPPAPTPTTPPTTPPTSPPAPGVPAPGVTPPVQHAAPSQYTEFRVNGQPTTDFAAVQRHITALEGFQKETIEQGRKDFVAKLASDNKILAAAIPSTEVFALGLQPEQFTAWKATWDVAPGNPALAKHGQQSGGTPGMNSRDDRIEVLKEQVAQHSRTGMSQENLQKLGSYKELQTLLAQA